jgi:signal-transduction protein with cAMP-binding, CBS, and nucleotidyltransferase domain
MRFPDGYHPTSGGAAVKVTEFMNSNIRFIDAEQTVYDAIEEMVDRRVRSLAVKFSEDLPGYGVITARDIVLKVLSQGKDPEKIKASAIASRPLFCLDSEASMFEAAQMMSENGVARVFICENGKLLGVVSMIDLMSAVLVMRARGERLA